MTVFMCSKFLCWSPSLHPKSIRKTNPSYNWVFLSDRNDLSSQRWLSARKGERKVCLFTLLSGPPRFYAEVNKSNALSSSIKLMGGIAGASASWPEGFCSCDFCVVLLHWFLPHALFFFSASFADSFPLALVSACGLPLTFCFTP